MIYVVQTVPGEEMCVMTALSRENIPAFVPRRELLLRKGGRWEKVTDKLFPCYVFLECDYTPEMHRTVTALPGVIRWLGKPSPIRNSEETFLRLIINNGLPIGQSRAVIAPDRTVTVTDGWLSDKTRYIKGYNFRKRRAYLELKFSGRTHRTSVSVVFTKVLL